MKKFELTSETKVFLGRTLYRIRALRAFGDVDKDELGGFIEKEGNLAHEGNAWVDGDAMVYGNAWVCGDAKVFGNAEVYGNALVSGNARISVNAKVYRSDHYLLVGPIGSRGDFSTFYRSKDADIGVMCGSFSGNIDDFDAAVTKTHGNNQHGRVYRMAIEMARAQIDLTDEDKTKSAKGRGMRLIDADALYEAFEHAPWFDNADRDIAEELLEAAPTVETTQ